MMNKFYITLALLVAFAIIILCLRKKQETTYIKEGEVLIDMIETYKEQTGELPDSVCNLNVAETMQTGPYYLKLDNTNYQVYFCLGFDEYFVYDSKKRKWTYSP